MHVHEKDRAQAPSATGVRESPAEARRSTPASGGKTPRWESDAVLANGAFFASFTEGRDGTRVHGTPKHRTVQCSPICRGIGPRLRECAGNHNRIRSRCMFDRVPQAKQILLRCV